MVEYFADLNTFVKTSEITEKEQTLRTIQETFISISTNPEKVELKFEIEKLIKGAMAKTKTLQRYLADKMFEKVFEDEERNPYAILKLLLRKIEEYLKISITPIVLNGILQNLS